MKIKTVYIFAVTTMLLMTTKPVMSLYEHILQSSKQFPGNKQAKISQCNQIITIINKAVKDANASTNAGQNLDKNSLIRSANLLELHAKELESLSIIDSQLQGYRLQLIKMYRNTSSSARNFVNALNSRDRLAGESALRSMQEATKGEKQLLNDINRYCST